MPARRLLGLVETAKNGVELLSVAVGRVRGVVRLTVGGCDGDRPAAAMGRTYMQVNGGGA